MILFTAEKVGLHYPGRSAPAFSDISLTIRKGETLRLTGPSGAGKTSLMRVIAGLQQPTSGRVTVLPRRTGMAFAEPRLLPRLSVRDNLLFVAPQAGGEVQAMLEALDMGGLDDSAADSLSRGQAQRVALIRALIVRPELLLLDEALSGLDPRCWQFARDLILRRRRDDAFALVEISHDPARLIGPGAGTFSLA